MSRPEPGLRVLMTADTVGGVWIYALDLCRALAAQGVEVALATMGGPLGVDQRRAVAALDGVQVFESSYRLEWMRDPWADVARAGEWLCDLERALRPDVVHLNSFAHGALPWRAPVVVVAHSCVLSWWRAVKGEEAPAAWNTYRSRVREGLAGADLVVAPTRAMLEEVERLYQPPGPARVIPNGRDPSGIEGVRKEPFVFAAGRFWDEAKNLASLAACSARLPWPVYIAGPLRHPDSGPDGGPGRDLGVGAGQRRAAGRNTHLLGRIPPAGVAWWLARASIYALPARYEPFGLSALEAAFAGCALVLGDVPSLREVWGDAATFVPPGDADALVAALRALMDDPGRRLVLARRARERAACYLPGPMASAYLDAYAELCAARLRRKARAR